MTRNRRWRGGRKGKEKDGAPAKTEKAAALQPKEQLPVFPPLKVGQRVRLCDPFRPAGGRCSIGTVSRIGDTVDIKWDDGRVSHMLTLALVEPHVDTEEDNKAAWRE